MKGSSCAGMAIAIKIIIKQKRINATFKGIEARPQKTVIQLKELKFCLCRLASEDGNPFEIESVLYHKN
jgi:hypothetical protein